MNVYGQGVIHCAQENARVAGSNVNPAGSVPVIAYVMTFHSGSVVAGRIVLHVAPATKEICGISAIVFGGRFGVPAMFTVIDLVMRVGFTLPSGLFPFAVAVIVSNPTGRCAGALKLSFPLKNDTHVAGTDQNRTVIFAGSKPSLSATERE